MFGYVSADLAQLDAAQKLRYHSAYCGLCRALYEHYGVPSALFLTYDMTFLALVLGALYEPKEQTGAGRCARHPCRAQSWTRTEFTDYAAAMNCLLAWENCRDDWRDEHKLGAWAGASALRAGARRAEAHYGQKALVLRRCLARIAEAEQNRAAYSEAPANAFGDLMAELFSVRDDHWTGTLRAFGYSLGKLIYFLDAACDLQADRKTGSYNPLALLGVEDGAAFRPQLELLAGDAAAEFERLPIVQDAALLRNILYAGVWTRFDAAFSAQKERI